MDSQWNKKPFMKCSHHVLYVLNRLLIISETINPNPAVYAVSESRTRLEGFKNTEIDKAPGFYPCGNLLKPNLNSSHHVMSLVHCLKNNGSWQTRIQAVTSHGHIAPCYTGLIFGGFFPTIIETLQIYLNITSPLVWLNRVVHYNTVLF